MSVLSRVTARAVVIYLLVCVLWFLLCDQVSNAFFAASPAGWGFHLVSGGLWAVGSALLIGWQHARQVDLVRAFADSRQANRESRRLAAAVFDCTADGVLVTDTAGRILHVNRAFMAITGYNEDEVLGQNPSKFKSGHHPPTFYQQMFGTLAEHDQWSGEIWNRRKGGDSYPQWQTIRAIRDDHENLSHYVAVFSDISAIRHSQRELAHLAHHDPLTGLPNRLLFSDRAEQALSAAKLERRSCALLLIDLDHFQNVNDSFGHGVGDQLLMAVVERLQARLDEGVTLARLGGDEFAVLMEGDVRSGQVAALGQALLEGMRAPFAIDGHTLFITGSMGISSFPEDAQCAGQLLRNADSALFQAKASGRSSYALYTEALTARAQQQVEVTAELRQALADGQLRVHYQPVHALRSGAMVGVEALVRWQHPERGLVPPGQFIPIAERSGLIAEIDAWVLTNACRQMCQWQAEGKALDFVAVNISSRMFSHHDLFQQVRKVLAETGLAPANLELEVTESAVMDDPDRALEQLHRLRDLGLQLAIDDFGTGYSSLLRLKRLPVHKLKIDQGFVAGLPGDEDDVAITTAIIALASSMGMQVHAEGIEQGAQAQFLLEHGCELGQGYWFGRPVNASALPWQGHDGT
jgi:diguanylate cyclase (GGDEF)-like protein/PAS domain S-box-containing protein